MSLNLIHPGTKIRNYTIIESIGNGKYSMVFSAIRHTKKNPPEKVCIKIHYPHDQDNYELAHHEVKMMKTLQAELSHPNIVKMIEHFDHIFEKKLPHPKPNPKHGKKRHPSVHKTKVVCIVYELLGMNLFDLIHDEGPLQIDDALLVLKQILTGLSFLHKKGIIHGDIKPENIVVGGNPTNVSVKIVDFGSAYHHTSPPEHTIQTIYYQAPEVILSIKPYTTKVDVWAVICTWFELLTKSCFFDLTNDNLSVLEPGYKDNQEEDDKEDDEDEDEDEDEDDDEILFDFIHLMKMHAMFGPIPDYILSKGQHTHYFYNRAGKLRSGIPIPFTGVDEFVRKFKINCGPPGATHFELTEIVEFIQWVMKYDPEDRPTIDEILDHKIFTKLENLSLKCSSDSENDSTDKTDLL